MKKILVVLFLLTSTVAFAQVPPAMPTSKIAWDQDAPTLADAQGYTYRYYADTTTSGVALVGVTCTGTASPYQCQVAFPAFTPGAHTLVLTAGNAAGESPKSTPPLSFTFVVIPGAPKNLVIK